MKNLYLLLLLLLSYPCSAGLGPEFPRYRTPHNLCLLDFAKPNSNSYTGICSGILLNSSTILTAAHCLDRAIPQTIRCGSGLKFVDFKRDSITLHPRYQKRVLVNDVVLDTFDVALIFLKKPVATSSLELISLTSAKKIPIREQQCGFFGFSQLLGKSKKDVHPQEEPHGWKVDLMTISKAPAHEILQMQGLRAPGGLLQVGDSGGPLMCRYKGSWHLLGINSSRDFFAHSNFISIAHMSFIKKAQKSSLTIPLPLDQNRAFRLRQLNVDLDQITRKIKRLKLDPPLFSQQVLHIKNLIETTQDVAQINSSLRKLEDDVIKFLLTQNNIALRLKPYARIDALEQPHKKSIGDLNVNFFQAKHYNLDDGTAFGRLKTFGPSNYFTCEGELLCRSEIIEHVFVSIKDFDIFKAQAEKIFQ